MAISKIITSSLTDDVVTSAKIGTDQVGADALSSSAISGAVDIPANSVGESELSVDYTAQSVPHIVPGVLYPSYVASGTSNKLLDGTTDHSGAFGTEQSDGRKYYYTNIAGSKPIKDPRIGAHFGSQRHKTKSLQLLEQETATHGKNIYSVDGREWCRGCLGGVDYGSDSAEVIYFSGTDTFLEIVGYFSDANVQFHNISARRVRYTLDGTDDTTDYAGQVSVTTPLAGRYVEAGGLENLGLGATLGIHTLKLRQTTSGHANFMVGFELIAQDTASTARRSEIKIPKQNVVSFGKKFEVGSDDLDNAIHPHYDPFSAKTDGSAWTSPTSGTNNANSAASWPTNIDTTHSLGLDKWVDGSSYYRPYNGGRVVKYVDSTGTIKTAVTVMPPNAKSIKSADVNKKAKNAGNTTYLPTFEDETTDVNEDQLHEVAKTFHYREFGNGSANGGTGSANYADASMLNSSHSIAYVMDDGLSSLSGYNVANTTVSVHSMLEMGAGEYYYVTFIGTGFSIHNLTTIATNDIVSSSHVAQNLPYGSHVVKVNRTGTTMSVIVDGVEVYSATNGLAYQSSEFSFHQPKKPPIPEDCVVIADYMLMADYVKKTTDGINFVSKGVRKLSTNRDIFYNTSGTFHSDSIKHDQPSHEFGIAGIYTTANLAAGETQAKLPAFATSIELSGNEDRRQIYIDGSAVADTDNGSGVAAYTIQDTPVALGTHLFEARNKATTNFNLHSMSIVSPIHTSHHYQTFETPFLHELVAGDRNMEQTNLVVSPDGKTWDEVTRNTSYIGNTELLMNDDEGDWNTGQDYKLARGVNSNVASIQKDFAIGFDRFICLVDGTFSITYHGMVKHDGSSYEIQKNGSTVSQSRTTYTSNTHGVAFCHVTLSLTKGDYIQTAGQRYLGSNWGRLTIERV